MDVRTSLLALVAISAILPGVGATAQELPRAEAVSDCFVTLPDGMAPNSGAECGYVVVPQNRTGGPDGEIRLAYMRLRAAGQMSAPPLFMLAGGPGQTMIRDDVLLLFQPDFLGPVLAGRDVVLIEQRGTYRARPNLACPESHQATVDGMASALDEDARAAMELDGLRACIARLAASGVDLASYNNVESAADVDDVRAALGYQKFVFYGGSYATLLGQYVMRDFAGSLAGVILDGTDDLSARSWVENRAVNAQWGLDNLTKLCAGQPECARAFDIPGLVDRLFDLFGDEPVTVRVALPQDSASAGEVEVTATKADLAALIYGLQTSKYGVAALPLTLSQLTDGGRDAILQILGQAGSDAVKSATGDDESGMTTLMHLAMVCSDDPVRALDEIKMDGVGTYARAFAEAEAREYIQLCGAVAVPQLSDSYDARVHTDVPVLLLSGGLDVQTPYFLSANVAKELPNATHVVFPAGFHVQVANINRCAMRIVLAFLDDLGARPDLGCVSDEAPLPFVLPEVPTGRSE